MIQKEGPGWRLARDPSRKKFPLMIGGSGWAIELTEDEWASLILIVRELIEQHDYVKDKLMEEESICLEIERSYWWACLEGTRSSWSLHLILNADDQLFRSAEAFWPVPAAQELTSAMRTMWDSPQ